MAILVKLRWNDPALSLCFDFGSSRRQVTLFLGQTDFQKRIVTLTSPLALFRRRLALSRLTWPPLLNFLGWLQPARGTR